MLRRRKRRRFAQEQKRKIAAEVQRRVREGEPFSGISRDLDIREGSLRLWVRQFPAAEILPVTVERTRSERAASSGTTVARISLVTPEGLRFEGLELGDVATLLEQLR